MARGVCGLGCRAVSPHSALRVAPAARGSAAGPFGDGERPPRPPSVKGNPNVRMLYNIISGAVWGFKCERAARPSGAVEGWGCRPGLGRVGRLARGLGGRCCVAGRAGGVLGRVSEGRGCRAEVVL